MYRLGITLLLIILALSSPCAQDRQRPEQTGSLPRLWVDSLRVKYIDSLTYRPVPGR